MKRKDMKKGLEFASLALKLLEALASLLKAILSFIR